MNVCPPGWSLDCLQEWGQFIQVAVPSMLMLCLEWWTFEIGGFLAGVIGDVELGAQSVVHQVVTIAFMVILYFGCKQNCKLFLQLFWAQMCSFLHELHPTLLICPSFLNHISRFWLLLRCYKCLLANNEHSNRFSGHYFLYFLPPPFIVPL